MAEITHLDLGAAPYDLALELQDRLAAELAGQGPPVAFLVLVEHDPPVITLGRSARPEHVLASAERMAAAGVQVRAVSRGGDVTWHGPGQLVAYPILRLDRYGKGLRQYLRDLEEVVLRVLGRFGLAGRRIAGLTGVWIGDRKIAAIGVAVRKWVTWHGLSLNVSADLSGFDLIVPCGIRDVRVTSLSAQLGRSVSVAEVKQPLIDAVGGVFGMDPVAALPEVLARHGVARPVQSRLRCAPVTLGPGSNSGIPARSRPGCAGRNARVTGTMQPASSAGSAQTPASPGRFPPWMRKRLPPVARGEQVLQAVSDLHLSTVCREARCPNQAECHSRGTATFLILGDTCTRTCGFCAIGHGSPLPPRQEEPEAVAEAAGRMGLRHVVITSVTRDDLLDGGAGQFARTIRAVRARCPRATIEVLTSDFQGMAEPLRTVLGAGPDVLNHNVETVPRLYPLVRPRAQYARSLDVLRRSAAWPAPDGRPGPTPKSGLMVGLGETDDEVAAVLGDLREAGCRIVTIGQYLAPTPRHLPVERFVEPSRFDRWRRQGMEMGFDAVLSGPYVRSSYHAEELLGPPREEP